MFQHHIHDCDNTSTDWSKGVFSEDLTITNEK